MNVEIETSEAAQFIFREYINLNFFAMQPRQDKNFLYRQDEPNERTKEGPLSFVLHKPTFASDSTNDLIFT